MHLTARQSLFSTNIEPPRDSGRLVAEESSPFRCRGKQSRLLTADLVWRPSGLNKLTRNGFTGAFTRRQRLPVCGGFRPSGPPAPGVIYLDQRGRDDSGLLIHAGSVVPMASTSRFGTLRRQPLKAAGFVVMFLRPRSFREVLLQRRSHRRASQRTGSVLACRQAGVRRVRR